MSQLQSWKAFLRRKKIIEKDVQVKRLDDFGIADVDFIKIDVEGHELEVLKGGAATIERYRPVLLMEVHSNIKDFFKMS